MKQRGDQTEIMLEEACIIRPAFNYSDIWLRRGLAVPHLTLAQLRYPPTPPPPHNIPRPPITIRHHAPQTPTSCFISTQTSSASLWCSSCHWRPGVVPRQTTRRERQLGRMKERKKCIFIGFFIFFWWNCRIAGEGRNLLEEKSLCPISLG